MLNKDYMLLVNQSVYLFIYFIKYCNLLQQCGYTSY